MPFVGADTGQLRSLADDLSRRSKDLTGDIIPGISGRLAGNPWHGPDRQQFDHLWNSQLVHKINNVAAALEDAARTVRKNADDQDRASGNDGSLSSSSGSHGGSSGRGGHVPSVSNSSKPKYSEQEERDFEMLLSAISNGNMANGALEDGMDLIEALQSGRIDYKAFSEWMGSVKGLDASTLLSLAGMGVTAKELGEAIGSNDPAATLEASLDLVMGAVGIKVPVAGLAWDTGKMLGKTGYDTLQNVYDSPTSALNSAARSIYGPDASWESLNQDQRNILMTRYDGMQGILVSNVDHVMGAAHDVKEFVGDRVDDAKDFVGDRVEDVKKAGENVSNFAGDRVEDAKNAINGLLSKF